LHSRQITLTGTGLILHLFNFHEIQGANSGGNQMFADSSLIEEVGNTAYEYEKVYYGCFHCALKALREYLDLGDGLTFKTASAFSRISSANPSIESFLVDILV